MTILREFRNAVRELATLVMYSFLWFTVIILRFRTVSCFFIDTVMHLSMSSPRGRGCGWEGCRAWGEILTFSKKNYQNPHPRAKKISRNKWFTSDLLFKIDRSNAWCQVKIPTLGICITVKFPWVVQPPPLPLGLDIDRCITSTLLKIWATVIWLPLRPLKGVRMCFGHFSTSP